MLTLVRVMVITDTAPAATVVGLKDLLICGLATCNKAPAAAVLAPPLLVRAPIGMLLK